MNRRIKRNLVFITAFALAFSVVGSMGGAMAAGGVYVNDGNNTLSGSLGSAYAIGGGGSVSVVGDTYAITGSGTVKVGESGGEIGEVIPAPDGVPVKIKTNIARIGLYYYYSASRDTALSSANLENKVGSGYKFGYYDSSRSFVELGSTAERKITMKPTGSGREVSVYITGTDTVIYTHKSTTNNLAVLPISTSGKAVTWFKNNTYNGGFEYYRYISDRMTVINVLELEDYIKGILPFEMSSSWPIEALKAQALCARSYFARNVNSYSKYGFDITADTYCQAYLGTGRSSSNSDSAVDQTAGEYITYNGAVCDALYFSSDGGGTEDSENIFVSALPYLRGVIDPYEESVPISMNGYKTWTRGYTGQELSQKLSSYGMAEIASVDTELSRTGNVIKLKFTDINGKTSTFSKSSVYSVVGLPSIRFAVSKSGDTFTFSGSGWGHSVGMSQFGAYAMVKNYGMSYRQVIAFYYTGVKISKGTL